MAAPLLAWSTDTHAQPAPSAARCQTDDEASAAERAQYEQPALAFVQALLSDAPAKAYELFASDAKASIPESEFVATSRRNNQAVGALSNLRVLHSYRISLATVPTGPAQVQRVQCAAVAHGNASKPDGWVVAAALPVPVQAHVIVEGKGRNASWNFVVWLTGGQPRWVVLRYDELPATILDKSAQDLWTMARAQRGHKHNFNAFILLQSALQLTNHGPTLQLGTQIAIEKDLASMVPPPHLKGKPPFVWTAGTQSFRVVNVAPVGVGSTFALGVRQELAQWGDDKYLERQNQALLGVLKTSYPEYSEVFGAVVVEAVRQGGTEGYRTVDESRKKPH